MNRIALWALSTLTVLVLLFGYHTSTSGALSGTVTTATAPAIAGSSTSSSNTQPRPGSGSASGTGAGSHDGGSSGSGSTTTTVTGRVAQTRWGPVQVELSMNGSSITDVSVLQYPSGNGQDVEISKYALPILINETLDAQTANIDMVSGATYTSEGYLQSLQSALDQAGA